MSRCIQLRVRTSHRRDEQEPQALPTDRPMHAVDAAQDVERVLDEIDEALSLE